MSASTTGTANESNCPEEQQLRRFAARALAAAEADAVDGHLAECADCQERVAQFTLTLQNAAAESQTDGQDRASPRESASVAATEAQGEPGEVDDFELGFLSPSTDSRSLGKIGGYDVQSVVGRGGMGIVLKAFDPSLQRLVAIKVLTPALASNQKARRRFLREARAAAAVNHPNVITIHGVDEQSGMPYLVMEFIGGCTLRERIRAKPRLEMVEILRIAAQIATGLAAAHQQGVVHRDIKPSNIMLEDGIERVKIADFGLARAAMDLSDITSLGQTVGTPSYISPEQVTGGNADERSDLFSLGCVIYAMVTGHSPFRGTVALDVIRKVADYHPKPLAEVDERVPQTLSDLVEKLLEKDPKDRCRSAREVGELLMQRVAEINLAPSDRLPQLTAARPRRRRAMTAGVTASALLACLAVAVWGAKRWQDSALDTAEAPPAETPAAPSTWRQGLITVAQADEADFDSIAEALAAAGPGATIRILDRARYRGPLALEDSRRYQGVTLESTQGAELVAPGSSRPVLSVKATQGVTVRGLRLSASARQFGIYVSGRCDGLLVENCEFSHPSDTKSANLVLDQAAGSAERPLRLKNLKVGGNYLGLAIIGKPGAPVSFVRIEGCEFISSEPGTLLTLENAVRNVSIAHNIFSGGVGGIHISLPEAGGGDELAIENNTFFRQTNWIALLETNSDQGRLQVRNNLVLECRTLLIQGEQYEPAVIRWFENNWWELASAADAGQVKLVCAPREPQETLAVLSRDSNSADFLRPADDSPLASGAVGAEVSYVGAVVPAPSPELNTSDFR